MLTNPQRAAVLAGALSLLALAGPIASASAEVASSQITSPAGPTYALNNEAEPSPPPAFTVEGKATGSGNVTLRCYYGKEAKSYVTFVKEVTPELSGSFSAKVEPTSLYRGPCVLRAVPVGKEEAHAPGTPAEEAADPFKGPRIVGSRFKLYTESAINYNYDLTSSTLAGYLDITSVGECGLAYSYLYAPETLVASNGLFDCNAALYEENSSSPASSTRSELQIDGANAYSPAATRFVEEALKAKAPLPGAPHVTATESFHEGLVTVTEVDPIVKCSPSTAFPPTPTSCTSFVSTGVSLEREWQTSSADRVASMTDTWRSTDGASHSLNALYDQATENSEEGSAYQFPGTNVFAATTKGETVTLPAGLGRIYYKEDAATPGEGDGVHPQGAIVYDTPPSGPISIYRGTAAKEGINGFQMPYQATIPAGGTYTLHMAFIQAYKLSEVEALASKVLEGYPPSSPPALSIASPTSGTTVSTPNVAVSGTVTDTRAITSFTVDGQTVSVGAGGAWSTNVPLLVGANTIKALATDQAGFSTEKTVSVTYKPIPPVAHASQVGAVRGTNGEVTFTIACTGSAGTSCEVESTVTTIEQTHNGRLLAVSARRHHHGNRSTTVTVGSSKVTIPAGQRVTIAIQLNSTGKSLLARFGALPVHLTVFQLSGGHRSTVIAQNLTVTRHHRHRRHHHHHHRR